MPQRTVPNSNQLCEIHSPIPMPPFYHKGGNCLSVAHQIAEAHLECFGDSHQGIQRDIDIAALDFAQVFVTQAGLFSQLLLTQFRPLAISADFLAHNSTIWKCHNALPKQEAARNKTRYMCYFILAYYPRFPDCRCSMNTQPIFLRRIGNGPGQYCQQTVGCPDIWELADGDFAVIGTDITDAASSKLPPTAGCGPDERIVRLPRNLLVNARRDIPERL
jgi:hypothetical protein